MRVPRPIYFEKGVINFYSENEILKFTIYVWDNEGMRQVAYKSGVYNDNADELIREASQLFGDVIRQ